MKRPGDEPSTSLQRASKLQKSVTFLLPGGRHNHLLQQTTQHQHHVTPSPPTTSSSSQPRSSPATAVAASSVSPATSPSGNDGSGSVGPAGRMPSSSASPSRSSQSHGVHVQSRQGAHASDAAAVTGANGKSTLRSASASSQSSSVSAAATPSRFTFDFADDASLSNSSSRRSSFRSHGYRSSPNNVIAQVGSTHAGGKGGRSVLSPSRLDSRYAARLPPGYSASSPSNSGSVSGSGRSWSYGSHVGSEVKRNLFGVASSSVGGGSAAGGDNGDAMDESSDFGNDAPSQSRASSASMSPGGGGHRHYYGRQHSSRSVGSTAHTTGTSSVSVASTGAGSRSACTFLDSTSPRRLQHGAVTGVSSPLSGSLGRTSVCSSVAGSPCGGGSVHVSGGAGMGGSSSPMALDYYEQRGAGDRYIPSRAISNLNFELSAGNGRSGVMSASSSGVASNGAGNAAGNNGASAASSSGSPGGGPADVADVDLGPAPSFGATMMGGAPVADDVGVARGSGGMITTVGATSAAGAGGSGIDGGLAPTFSDDGTSAGDDPADRHDATNRQPLLYDALLRSELLGENIDPAAHTTQTSTGLVNSGPSGGGANGTGGTSSVVAPFRERSNNLRFSPSRQFYANEMNGALGGARASYGRMRHSSIVNSFGLTPVSMSPNQRTNLGSYTERCKRKIAKVPTKVLDAPALQDDFYLNLVDWSSQNVLAVGLGSCVYLWSAATSRVTQLCDLSSTEDAVTSVAWSEGGKHLAIGSTRGDVQLWDAPAQKLVRTMTGHTARVGALSWKLAGGGGGGASGSASLLASGSRDRFIHLRDPRSDGSYEMKLQAHKQEVCGLRWSFDDRSMLASGGNDNKLLVWDIKKHTNPYHTFADHTAAVKAIAWSPHQHGLLASGGGTADRCIRFWNCLTGHGINCIDTGSQVCNLAFSRNCNELVSTHGYSLNQIVVWKYPSMQKVATLTGHTYRVLYLALSPDGSTIVTGAGDETLRFWQVFPGPQKENKAGGLLFPAGMPGSVIR